MKKTLIALSLSAIALFGQQLTQKDIKLKKFLTQKLNSNPSIKNAKVSILEKKQIKKDWNGYLLKIDADLIDPKTGKVKKHISQNATYFFDGKYMTSGFVDTDKGVQLEIKRTLTKEFLNKYYKKSNLIIGNGHSRNKVIIFSDPQCPICQRVVPRAIRYLKKKKNVDVYYYNLPLTSLHPASQTLVKISKYFEKKHDLDGILALYDMDILSTNDQKEIIKAFNEASGYNIKLKDIQTNDIAKKLAFDKKAADEFDVKGTPTIYTNGQEDRQRSMFKKLK